MTIDERGEAAQDGTTDQIGGVASAARSVLEDLEQPEIGVKGSNPEEMIGAALAGCFSMALSLGLEKAGMTPQSIRTNANVHLEKEGEGFAIKKIELSTEVSASGGDDKKFQAIAAETKKQCPVSKALGGTENTLTAKLAG